MKESPAIVAIAANTEIRRQAAEALPKLILEARTAGCTWNEIIEASGLSRAHVFHLAKTTQPTMRLAKI